MVRKSTKPVYNIGDILDRKHGRLKILEKIWITYNDGQKYRGYQVKCLDCGHEFKIIESNLDKGCSCPICNHHQVAKGVNDLWTTHPEFCKYLVNPEDGYRYSFGSRKQVQIKCINCGEYLGFKTINNAINEGVSCPHCSDGVSYPNKMMFNLLNYLKEDFEVEKGRDWCVFPSFQNFNIDTFGKYDFIIENKKIIVEMDSDLGHGQNIHSLSHISKEESLYRDKQKDLLAKQNGYHIIRISCLYASKSYLRFEICKKAILESELSKIYDLSMIPWELIGRESLDSSVIHSINLFNSGMSIKEISKTLKKHMDTIHNYLLEGNKLNLCKFIPKNLRGQSQPVKSNKDQTVYDSIKKYKYYNGKNNDYTKITRLEFNSIKSRFPESAYGEFFNYSIIESV